MFEGVPSAEKDFSPKPLSEDMVANFLKIEGPEASGFVAWIEEERKRLKGENPAEAEARLGAKLARIYYMAGYIGDGLERIRYVRNDAAKINGEFLKEVEETIARMERHETL